MHCPIGPPSAGRKVKNVKATNDTVWKEKVYLARSIRTLEGQADVVTAPGRKPDEEQSLGSSSMPLVALATRIGGFRSQEFVSRDKPLTSQGSNSPALRQIPGELTHGGPSRCGDGTRFETGRGVIPWEFNSPALRQLFDNLIMEGQADVATAPGLKPDEEQSLEGSNPSPSARMLIDQMAR